MNNKQLNRIIIFLLSFYLLIDATNGFLTLRLGLDVKLSVLYKSVILLLVIIAVIKNKPRYLIGGLILFLVLFFSEFLAIYTGKTTGDKLAFTIQHIIKVLTYLVLFIYLKIIIDKDPLYIKKVEKIIQINCAVYLTNIFLGIAGFGFSTYGGDVNESSVGVKGFFYAGNEISMLMVVFSAYVLGKSYYKSKKLYLFWALLWIIVGFAISTKTAMAANLLLVIFIPIAIEGRTLINFSNKKSYYFAAFLTSFFISSFMVVSWFVETNIYLRLMYVFRKQGLIGILMSNRDLYLGNLLDFFFTKESMLSLLFGNGISLYADNLKYSAELDLPDIFFWQGIFGVIIVLCIFLSITKPAFVRFMGVAYPYAPVVLITNILLFIISNISGHVLTSGMLGFLWPCFCVLAFIRKDQLPNKVFSK